MMVDRISKVLRDAVRLSDAAPWIQEMFHENERYVRAGAGKNTAAGLCFGILPDGKLCPKTTKTEDSLWCRDHLDQAGSIPPRPGGPRGIPSEKRKLTAQQARQLRKLRYGAPKKWTIERLAIKFGLSQSSVASLIGGRHYRPPEWGQDKDTNRT